MYNLFRGLRESELLALRWADVSLENKRLTILKAKTEASERTRGLIPQVVAQLRQHRARLIEERLQAGANWKDQGPFEQGLVFPYTVGRRMDPGSLLASHFYPLLERAGLPRIHLPDLRHTTVTWLLSLGLSVVDVAQYVGHTDAATTLRFYAHALPTAEQVILEALERAMGGGPHG